jgi:short-subunit dehydrogenase
LLPLLKQQDDSQIVNIGSTFGSIGYPGFGAYCASKFGLRGFTESLRRELSGSGMQVSYIAPRATDTDLNSDNLVAMNDALGTAMDKPSLVANEVMQIINTPSGADKFLGWPEKLFVRINALLPSIVDSSLRKQLPIIRRYAKHGI